MRTRLLTTAIAGLALAALLGVLLPSDTAVHAAPPVFVSGNNAPSVPENTPPGVNIGDPVSATDGDEDGGRQRRHRVRRHPDLQPRRRADAASFDIDASTGQLITKAPLDYREIHAAEPETYYTVTVTVKDSSDTSVRPSQDVTITVTNVTETLRARPPRRRWCRPDDTDTDAATYEPEGDLVCRQTTRGRTPDSNLRGGVQRRPPQTSFRDYTA